MLKLLRYLNYLYALGRDTLCAPVMVLSSHCLVILRLFYKDTRKTNQNGILKLWLQSVTYYFLTREICVCMCFKTSWGVGGAGELAHQFGALATLREEQGSLPRTHTGALQPPQSQHQEL